MVWFIVASPSIVAALVIWKVRERRRKAFLRELERFGDMADDMLQAIREGYRHAR